MAWISALRNITLHSSGSALAPAHRTVMPRSLSHRVLLSGPIRLVTVGLSVAWPCVAQATLLVAGSAEIWTTVVFSFGRLFGHPGHNLILTVRLRSRWNVVCSGANLLVSLMVSWAIFLDGELQLKASLVLWLFVPLHLIILLSLFAMRRGIFKGDGS
jgi:hypothetical protein